MSEHQSSPNDHPASHQLQRRGLMTGLAALAAGLVAKLTTQPAEAGSGDGALATLGQTNSATSLTRIDRTGTEPNVVAFMVTNTNYDAIQGVSYSASSYGVYGNAGTSGGSGVGGYSGGGSGVAGTSDSGIGVDGHSNSNLGVKGLSTSSNGVYGTSAANHGVRGDATGSGAAAGYSGVLGTAPAGHGVTGQSSASLSQGVAGAGVMGISNDYIGVYGTSSSNSGVYGTTAANSTAPGVYGAGTLGPGCYGGSTGSHGVQAQASATGGHGVYAAASGSAGVGVYASSSAYYGVWGNSTSPAGYAGVVGTSAGGHGVSVQPPGWSAKHIRWHLTEPAPIHPHLYRHARVRQIVRATRSLPLAQRQAGWSRLRMAYLTVSDDEARRLMQEVPE